MDFFVAKFQKYSNEIQKEEKEEKQQVPAWFEGKEDDSSDDSSSDEAAKKEAPKQVVKNPPQVVKNPPQVVQAQKPKGAKAQPSSPRKKGQEKGKGPRRQSFSRPQKSPGKATEHKEVPNSKKRKRTNSKPDRS